VTLVLTARTEPGARLVALAEALAAEIAPLAAAYPAQAHGHRRGVMHSLGANRAYDLVGRVALGADPAIH